MSTYPASPVPSPSELSVSSETEIGEQTFSYPLMAPFKFGPGIYQIIGVSTAEAVEHKASGDDPVISKFRNFLTLLLC
jgi:hypothetical protein